MFIVHIRYSDHHGFRGPFYLWETAEEYAASIVRKVEAEYAEKGYKYINPLDGRWEADFYNYSERKEDLPVSVSVVMVQDPRDPAFLARKEPF